MSDFHQRGLISTLPRLNPRVVEDLEMQLDTLAMARPIALVLPCTLTDFLAPPMQTILREIQSARYFSRIVISINQTTEEDIIQVRQTLATHGDSRIFLLWNDATEVKALFPQACAGKGFNLWSALGFLALENSCYAVVSHDTDILNYTRELPALLALPLLDPQLDYHFVKGYYPRVSGQLFGRVTRLFIGPLLRALIRVEGHQPLLDFLDGFRYPLSGEFGARLELMKNFPLPAGWDLEMDLLCSTHRSLAPESIAQIDLGSNYEHKHQILSSEDPSSGLVRLASEIYGCLLRNLALEGVRITPDFQKALQFSYRKSATETIRRYKHVAALNLLAFEEENENAMVDAFSKILVSPIQPCPPALPSWAGLIRNHPAICQQFSKATGMDKSISV